MNNRLKILMINTTDKYGGAASVAWGIGNEMRSRGYSVKYIVSRKYSNSKNVYAINSSRFHFISMIYRYARSFILSNDIDYGVAKEIINHPWYQKADIVHFHNLHGSYFQLDTLKEISNQKKIIWTIHDMWPICADTAYSNNQLVWKKGKSGLTIPRQYPFFLWDNSKYLWNKKKQIYKKINLNLVAPSKWMLGVINNSILSDQKISLISNGVNEKFYKPSINKNSIRKILNLPEDKKILIFVTNKLTDRRKGWYIVKEAIKDQNLLVIAIGAKKKHSKERVAYIPRMDKKLLLKYLQASDAMLVAASNENLSLSILEGMSVGLPIIGYSVGGSMELLKHQPSKLTTRKLSISGIANAIREFMCLSKSSRSKISKNNRNFVANNYSKQAMIDKYEKLYKEVSK